MQLVGHGVMGFDGAQNNGGADGCIDCMVRDDLGFKGCMLQSIVEWDPWNISLESMWQGFCLEVSAADFFAIAAEALMEATGLCWMLGSVCGSRRYGFRWCPK